MKNLPAARSARFPAILAKSRRSLRAGRGLKAVEFWRKAGREAAGGRGGRARA